MNSSKTLFDRRRGRVRYALRKKASGRPRLSVFRSSKHIYAQVIDDVAGRTLAAASTVEKDLRASLKTGADTAAAAAVGKLLAERAVEGGRRAGGLRPGWLHLSWSRQGAGRWRPRGRPPVLNTDDGSREGRHNMARNPNERGGGDRDRGRQRGGDRREERDDDFKDKLVHINRVAKVVKGGRRFAFAALVVVGDGKGRVGFGTGKAREVPEAIRKATEQAKRTMIRVPLREGRTLHHDIKGHFGAGRVTLRAAPGRHRHHRRRPDARGVRDHGRAGRGEQVQRHHQSL